MKIPSSDIYKMLREKGNEKEKGSEKRELGNVTDGNYSGVGRVSAVLLVPELKLCRRSWFLATFLHAYIYE